MYRKFAAVSLIVLMWGAGDLVVRSGSIPPVVAVADARCAEPTHPVRSRPLRDSVGRCGSSPAQKQSSNEGGGFWGWLLGVISIFAGAGGFRVGW